MTIKQSVQETVPLLRTAAELPESKQCSSSSNVHEGRRNRRVSRKSWKETEQTKRKEKGKKIKDKKKTVNFFFF